jgi:hypothetical protein
MKNARTHLRGTWRRSRGARGLWATAPASPCAQSTAVRERVSKALVRPGPVRTARTDLLQLFAVQFDVVGFLVAHGVGAHPLLPAPQLTSDSPNTTAVPFQLVVCLLGLLSKTGFAHDDALLSLIGGRDVVKGAANELKRTQFLVSASSSSWPSLNAFSSVSAPKTISDRARYAMQKTQGAAP